MAARAVVRHVRMSPRKMRVVANLVRGKRVDEAMSMLKLMPKKGAAVIRKLIISAAANAEHSGITDVDQLLIRDCNVDNGPILKRWMPRSMGRANRVNHRTSHATVRGVEEYTNGLENTSYRVPSRHRQDVDVEVVRREELRQVAS